MRCSAFGIRVAGAVAAAVTLILTILDAAPRAQTRAIDGGAPKLVVLLVVDQMRADYVERYGHQWSSGLRRLIEQGAWFRQAQYPYYLTVTCSGHSTIVTGVLPSTHGMIGNEWWDAGTRRPVTCTDDPTATTLSYGAAVPSKGESLARLRTPTLADELRAQLSPASRVIAFSLKARSAAPLGGRHPDAIAWFDDGGTWATSSAFSRTPAPEVADYVRQHPVEAEFSKVWDRALPLTEYLFEPEATGVGVVKGGMTPGFPHSLAGASAAPDRSYYARWQSSPFADEYLARMAVDVARRMHLGTTSGSTDMIGVSFSTLDKVGHDYGPNSHEIQDVLIRLDRTLGEFFGDLDRLVGRGNYVVALSADHGVAPMPERAREYGLDAGRIDEVAIVRTAEAALSRAFGRGTYVSQLANNDLYLQPGVYGRLRDNAAALQGLRDALRTVDGIQSIYTRDDIEGPSSTRDPMLARVAGSHFAGRNGDITLVSRPYWIFEAEGTTHGTGYAYDAHVPIVLMGKGILPGQYLGPASPLDIAPTLAFLSHVTLPYGQGRVLSEALTTSTAAASETR